MTDDLRSLPGVAGAEAQALLTKALRCRRLAAQSLDQRAAEALKALAEECETRAAELAGPSRVRAA
ncbi:hypothetical protein [Lichenibacterium dinghuense]|uniref:hypothetical protein n=1 Tax=Lichenibacterium dinghuense TaxID=2895977 RepID=UPI001F1E99D6|nr:hypothetical protein [Lichenibacterium sp. 6Y81]